MKKVVSVAAALFAVHAWAAGSSGVVCESLTVCRSVPMTLLPYEVPVIGFDTASTSKITITANVWWMNGCPGDPDATYSASGSVPPGSWYQAADIGEQPPDTEYSIQWIIDGCPILDCVDGLIGSTPEVCL
jgi:hypothetical protein